MMRWKRYSLYLFIIVMAGFASFFIYQAGMKNKIMQQMKFMPPPAAPKVGTTWGYGPISLVWIPPGTFLMGSKPEEEGHGLDEEPLHEVRITKGFWLGQFEVTQSQWDLFMEDNPSDFRGANKPVDGVSWNMCEEFCRRLNERKSVEFEGQFRFPTEAEWEYACRAGTTTSFFCRACCCFDQLGRNFSRSHALRGNANFDALRQYHSVVT